MHGILKLRAHDPGRPDHGLARALRRGAAPRRSSSDERGRGRRQRPRRRQDGHECLTRPAWSCSRRSCARPRRGQRARTRCYFRGKAALLVAPASVRRRCERLRGEGLRLPRLASTASTTTPRSRASACTTSCSTWTRVDRITRRSCACPLDAPEVAVGDAGLADRRPPGARGLRHVRRRLRRAIPTCGASSCPRTTRATRSAATSRSAASRSCSRTTRRDPGVVGVSERRHHAQHPAHPATGEMEESHDALPHRASRADDELLTLNIGPAPPGHARRAAPAVTLEGEVVRDVKPIIGYVHTGIEKTAEDKSYWKVIPVVERMDYLAYYFNAMAFCGAVETLLDIEVPKRAQYLRVIHLELNRIMSHLVWLGHQRARPRRDLDVLVLLPRARADPRPVRDVLRPAHAHALLPGRRRHRGHPRRLRGEAAGVHRRRCPTRVDQYTALLDKNEIVLQRLRNVARVDEETLLGLGVTGPLLRATGNPWDLRKATPVLELRRLRVQDPGRHDRRQLRPLRACRMAEIKESVRIIEQALDGLPEGAVHHGGPQGTRCRRATSWRPRWRR